MSSRHATNNFDFIRLLAAATVLYAHQYALIFQPEPRLFGLFSLGTLGVLIFFSTSGYLVVQSWERDPHWWRFLVRRFLRIWPGLAAVILVTVFCVGPMFTSLTLSDYFHSSVTWAYLKYLYLQMHLSLPGVFGGNPWQFVNGSLWTIHIEIIWYVILMVTGIGGLLRPRFRYVLFAMVMFYVMYIYFVFDVQHNPKAAYPLPSFGCEYGTFFCYGALLHVMRKVWMNRVVATIAVLFVFSCLLVVLNYQYAAVYLWIPFLVVWFGNKSTPVLRQAGRFGDFSYGIYVYAFLVQQAVIAVVGIHRPFSEILAVSSLFTMICAVLSWHLVERRALAFKRYLREPPLSDAAPIRAATIGTVP